MFLRINKTVTKDFALQKINNCKKFNVEKSTASCDRLFHTLITLLPKSAEMSLSTDLVLYTDSFQ